MVETYDVILSTDRSLMTNHHGNEFLGFGTTMPLILPRKFIQWLFAPPMKHKKGIVWEAPYGIRRTEAALLAAGIKTAVVDPDWVGKYLEAGAKVLVLRHHDWFGLNPPTSTWTVFIDAEPLNVVLFREFMENVMKLRDRLDFKLVVAGPAVWQWLHLSNKVDEYRVDAIVDSNGDREDWAVVKVVQRLLNGLPVPKYIKIGITDSVPIDKIVPIRHASVNGLVEIGLGCPRGCSFCSVGGRPLRWYPLDFIEEEIKVNVREGQKSGILSATDILLYGSSTIYPNAEAVLKVNRLAKKYWECVGWSHITIAAALTNKKLIRDLHDLLVDCEKQKFIGVEIGVESGSVKIMKKHMAAKPAPFPVERWPEVVEEGFALLHENEIIPASTLVVGLPGEEEDDVIATTELVKRLRPYRSLIVPMFFVPMGPSRLGRETWFRKLRPYHVDLLMACLEHDVYWAKNLLENYLGGLKMAPVKKAIGWFVGLVEKSMPRIRESLMNLVEKAMEAEKGGAGTPSAPQVSEVPITQTHH